MHHSSMNHNEGNKHYTLLLIMVLLSFAAMYVFMYAMVDVLANALPNLNQFYMAGLMTMPMVIIELSIMSFMYQKKKWNVAIVIASVIILVLFWIGIRQQIAISDKEFLQSMIPHHASAILMCEKAALRDARIIELCRNIVSSQQQEIDQMKQFLLEMN
ncbi:MAG TPA: DUF305 domain-containing protein [Candidatus Paceibacterota bacterium]|nr:DUF305 domain-containing protein [Candidatus Paceibacterota bacterium]